MIASALLAALLWLLECIHIGMSVRSHTHETKLEKVGFVNADQHLPGFLKLL